MLDILLYVRPHRCLAKQQHCLLWFTLYSLSSPPTSLFILLTSSQIRGWKSFWGSVTSAKFSILIRLLPVYCLFALPPALFLLLSGAYCFKCSLIVPHFSVHLSGPRYTNNVMKKDFFSVGAVKNWRKELHRGNHLQFTITTTFIGQ